MTKVVNPHKLVPNDGSVRFGPDEAVPYIRDWMGGKQPIVVTPADYCTHKGHFDYMILDGLLQVEYAKQMGVEALEVEVYYPD